MNVFGDLEDLEQALAVQLDLPNHKVTGSGSCSALVKLLPGNADLYFAHDTWNSYQNMIRVLKRYNLPFAGNVKKSDMTTVAAASMTFSGYPGVVYSGDDFTLTSAGLATMETTIGNSEPKLWAKVKPRGAVLEGIRATVANRLARTGEEWTKIFAMWNSGTYNNQVRAKVASD